MVGWLLYRKQITIPDANVDGSGLHTNFPVLIDITDPDLESVSNGGSVESNNGWDIAFSQDHTTALNHEIEAYEAANGRIVAWVQIPALDADGDNTMYLYFSNPNVVADPSTSATWDPASYVAVYHLQGNNHYDATANGYDGVATGTTNSAGSIIEDGQDFEQTLSNNRIEIGNFDVISNSLTISAWIRPESFTQRDARIVSKTIGPNGQDHWWMLSTIDQGPDYRLRFRQKAGPSNITNELIGNAASNLSIGIWSYLGAVYDGTTMQLYLNATGVGSMIHSVGGAVSTSSLADVAIGNQPAAAAGGVRPYDGILDEVRIQRAARNTGWLQTEYNNQLNPTSFYPSVGSTEIENDFPCRAIELPVNECYTPGV